MWTDYLKAMIFKPSMQPIYICETARNPENANLCTFPEADSIPVNL